MRLRRPSPSMVVALLALFVALGGGAYAAVSLPKNSVGAKQLKRNAVTGKKIKKSAVSSPKVKDGSLLSRDFKAGQLPAGTKGDKGDRGDQGPPGPTFGAAAVAPSVLPAATDPPASTTETSENARLYGRHFDFTLPSSGNVYIRLFVPVWAVSCSSGLARAGLYIDGTPVPGTSEPLPHGTDPAPAERVIVRPLAAGPHSLESRYDCPGATTSGYNMSQLATWTVLLLG